MVASSVNNNVIVLGAIMEAADIGLDMLYAFAFMAFYAFMLL